MLMKQRSVKKYNKSKSKPKKAPKGKTIKYKITGIA